MISTRARGCAIPSGTPQPTSTNANASDKVAPPTAAERKPETVTPIWTAERKRLGSAVRWATAWPRLPRPLSCLTWLSRSDTRAISAAAKTPPMRMKRKISAMLPATLFIGDPGRVVCAPGHSTVGRPPLPGC